MIKYDVRQVIEDDEGNIRLVRTVRDENVDESIDIRKMTREFLSEN